MKRILPIIIILVLLFVIRNIVVSIQTLLQNEHTLTKLQEQVQQKQQEHAFLQERLEYVQSNNYIEEEAREKLNLVKEGEYIILFPSPTDTPLEPQVKKNHPNWEKWWKLFM